MYTLNLAFKQTHKKITLPKNLSSNTFYTLIAQPFNLRQKIIGLTNSQGHLINFDHLKKNPSLYEKQKLYLIATQDINDDNMSFASEHGAQHQNDFLKKGKPFEPQMFQKTEIPQKLQGYYQGVIGDIDLFQELFLHQNKLTIVFCFVKEKPKNFLYPYYLYHTSKNSAIVYFGSQRICQFFIDSMSDIPKSIETFVKSFFPHSQTQNHRQQKTFNKKSKPEVSAKISSKQSEQKFSLNNHNLKPKQSQKEILFDSDDKSIDLNENQDDLASDDNDLPLQLDNDEDEENNDKQENGDTDEEDQANPSETEMQASLLQNLLKLRNEDQITELDFYKMKSELLQNLSDFMRKYQMGTRKGLRKDIRRRQAEQSKQPTRPKNSNRPKRQVHQERKYPQKQSKQERQEMIVTKQAQQRNTRIPQSKRGARSPYSRDQRRTKRYEIPIIVRKYNNVIEKISTSYPLTQEQEQSINLILELELKGLISEKQAGVYKTSILQEDKEVVALFSDYFDNLIDQLQLASHLKKIKKINSQKKERSQHNMRLLIKYAKQGSYELLRTLLLEKNHLVLAALEKFRSDKNAERLAMRLEKIAIVYRQKGQLEEDVFD